AELRAADAQAVGVGGVECEGGVAARAGGEVLQAEGGIRAGLRPPRRPPHEQHAGPGDAGYEQVLRGLPAPARLGGAVRGALPALGVAAHLRAGARGEGVGQPGMARPGGAAERAPLPRPLATEPLWSPLPSAVTAAETACPTISDGRQKCSRRAAA